VAQRLVPKARDLTAIGLTALALRIAVFATATFGFGYSLRDYARAGDGSSYEHYAAAMVGDRSQWTEYDKRVFPGYPAMIAAAHVVTRLDFGICALLIAWISAAIAAIASAVLFQDRRVGWAMVMLIPHWPVNSSLAMSEAPMLALTTGGLALGVSGMAAPAGALLGMAMTVRPVAGFPLAGLLINQLLSGRRREALATSIVAGVVVLGALQWVDWLTGDALHNLRAYADLPGAYAGRIFALPFQSLLQTTLYGHAPFSRILYIWAHVLLVLGACVLLVLRASAETRADGLERIAVVWLIGNTLFILCIASGPFGWGFYHFPRFMIPATPPLMWAFRRVLPQSKWFWIALTALMFWPTALLVRQAVIDLPMPAVFGR
jgi:hypothetical protein